MKPQLEEDVHIFYNYDVMGWSPISIPQSLIDYFNGDVEKIKDLIRKKDTHNLPIRIQGKWVMAKDVLKDVWAQNKLLMQDNESLKKMVIFNSEQELAVIINCLLHAPKTVEGFTDDQNKRYNEVKNNLFAMMNIDFIPTVNRIEHLKNQFK